MTVAGSSLPIFGRATLTTVPSRKTIDEPRMAATIVQRWRVCIGAVCDRARGEASLPAGPAGGVRWAGDRRSTGPTAGRRPGRVPAGARSAGPGARSAGPEPDRPIVARLPRDERTGRAPRRRRIPAGGRRARRRAAGRDRAGRGRGSRSCRRRRHPTARTCSGAGRRWASSTSRRSARRSRRSSSATAPRPTTRPRPGHRRGRPDLPVRRPPGPPAPVAGGERRLGGGAGRPRPRWRPGRLLGRGDGPVRPTGRSSGARRTCRCATRRRSGSCPASRLPALRHVPRADGRADDPAAPRAGR